MKTPLNIAILIAFTIMASLSQAASVDYKSEAPNWMAQTSNGQSLTLYDETAKNHYVVMIFWASWCRFCHELLPAIDEYYGSLSRKDVRFIALNVWEDNDPDAYMKNRKLSLPYALSAEDIASQYGVKGTPGVFVIGPDKEVKYNRQSGESIESVVSGINNALAGRAVPAQSNHATSHKQSSKSLTLPASFK